MAGERCSPDCPLHGPMEKGFEAAMVGLKDFIAVKIDAVLDQVMNGKGDMKALEARIGKEIATIWTEGIQPLRDKQDKANDKINMMIGGLIFADAVILIVAHFWK